MMRSAMRVLATLCLAAPIWAACSANEKELGLRKADDGGETVTNRQMVQVYDTTVSPRKLVTVASSTLFNAALQRCEPQPGSACHGVTGASCAATMCTDRLWLCATKTLLAAALPQSSMPVLGNYLVPPQSSRGNIEIAAEASIRAAAQLDKANRALRGLLGLPVPVPQQPSTPPPHPCGTANQLHTLDASTYVELASSQYAESYYTVREAIDVFVKSVVDASDSGALPAKLSLKEYGWDLSRRGAAHVLVGGDDGFDVNIIETIKPFCADDNLSPEGKAALEVLREAAVAPDDLDAPITDLLNSTAALGGSIVTFGSVRQRLLEFYPFSSIASGQDVAQFYRLNSTAFEEARSYLTEEFRVFARSATAVLPARRLPGGALSTFSRYSATASTPAAIDAAYYLASIRKPANHKRHAVWADTHDPPPFTRLTTATMGDVPPLSEILDATFSTAAYFIANQSAITNATARAAAMGPLALLASSEERLGRLDAAPTGMGSGFRFTVQGFGDTDGLILVSGEDGLRCATTGTIEGAPCSVASVSGTLRLATFNGVATAKRGFTKATTVSLASRPTGRVYVVMPRRPGIASPGAGDYKALVGADLALAADGTPDSGIAAANTSFSAPIVPSLNDRAAELLRPSKQACSSPRKDCSGGSFDERMPLENELADDGDGVESSWKHYLALAREAADFADALGSDYIQSGLDVSQNSFSVEQAREDNVQRATAEIQNLERLCGLDADPRELLALLVLGDSKGNLINATGGTCPTCTPTTSCSNNQCVLDINKIVTSSSNPDLQALGKCLTGGSTIGYASLGTVPLCLWTEGNNVCTTSAPIACNASTPCRAGLVCADGRCIAPPGMCPALKPTGVSSCDAFIPAVARPVNTVMVETKPLNYFDTPAEYVPGYQPTPPKTQCAAIAAANSGEYLAANVETLLGGNFFHHLNLFDLGNRVDWEARYNGYAAIYVDGEPRWRTGDAFGETSSTRWPCVAEPNCVGMFCQASDCSTAAGRAEANHMMFRAVVAARFFGRSEKARVHNTVLRALPAILPIDFRADGGAIDIVRLSAFSNFPVQRSVYASRESHFDNELRAKDKKALLEYQRDPTWTGFFPGAASNDANVQWYTPDGVKHIASTVSGGTAAYQAYWFGPHVVEATLRRTSDGEAVDSILSDHLFQAIQRIFRGDIPSADAPRTAVLVPPDLGGRSALDFPGAEFEQKPYLQLQDADIRRGAELLCAVSVPPGPFDLVTETPPRINTVDDLQLAAGYIEKMAQRIRAGASLSVFADVPTKAVDALRQESSSGAYSEFTGNPAIIISDMRTAFLQISQTSPLLANEVLQIGNEVRNVHKFLRKNAIRQDIANLQFASTMADQLARCGTAIASTATHVKPWAIAGSAAAAAITCANSLAQIGFADGIRDLTREDAELDSAITITSFESSFSTHVTNLQSYTLKMLEGFELLDSATARFSANANEAVVSLRKALYLASYHSEKQAEITTVLGNLYGQKQIRYERALENARRLSFLAKRAIEQRIGFRLADMTDDLPLVDAPAGWEGTVCDFAGVNYEALMQANPEVDMPGSLTAGFIGDYVTKLENVVESYRLEHNFHEGTDVAIVSLKNDLLNVRRECDQPGLNLLYHAGSLPYGGDRGWKQEACQTTVVGGVTEDAQDCVQILPVGVKPSPYIEDAEGYQLKFGAGSNLTTTGLVQSMDLEPGTYRFSWYSQQASTGAGGALAGSIKGTGITPSALGTVTGVGSAWHRYHRTFTISAKQAVRVGFWNQNTSSTTPTVTVAAPMLERLPTITDPVGLPPFSNTSDMLTVPQPVCEDTDGSIFRGKHWIRNCLMLCPDGFSTSCGGASAVPYCFRETKFHVNQRDLQMGKIMNFSGFARGNFNYRIESLGLNFVGTQTRDCSDSTVPTPCFSAGFIPFSVLHEGPFWVRNHRGQDFRALLFDGNIEHARGLALERYLTNPLSETDRGLLTDFVRTEFQGRPLDGTFTVRVWEEPGVDFDAIEDVQLMLNYRYWTRFD